MSALGQKQTLLLVGAPTFPQTDDHQPHGKSNKAAGDQVAHEMIVAPSCPRKTVAMQIAQIQRNLGYRNQNPDVIALMATM